MIRPVLAFAIVSAIVGGAACGLQLNGTAGGDGADASQADAVASDDASPDDGRVDDATADASCDPDATCDDSVEQLVGNGFSFCARTRGGNAYCWGRNAEGQLGVGDTAAHALPVRVSRQSDSGSLPPFVQLSTGYFHTCARTADDAVYCWGANLYGQLGQSLSSTSIHVPTRVGALFAGEIASGGTHTCAIDHAFRVQCWGENSNAQLGYASGSRVDAGEIACQSTTCNPQPTPASVGPAPSRLSLAYSASCAIIADGGVACWGDDSNGQLADPSFVGAVPSAENITLGDAGSLRGVSAIAGLAVSICAVGGDGMVRCWGANSQGNLGTSPSGPVVVPQPFGTAMNATAVAAGTAHTCIVANGRLSCAGWNGEGQLGGGAIGGVAPCPTFAPSQTPNQCAVGFVDVGLTNVVEVAANISATCGRTAAGKVYCWGENGAGQLGHAPGSIGDAPCNGTVGVAASWCNALPVEVPIP